MATILAKFILFFAVSTAAFAGQSLNVNTQSASNSSVIISSGSPWGLEMYVHDWNNSTILSNSAFFDANGLGYRALIINSGGGNIQLQVQEKFEQGATPFPICGIQLGPSANLPSIGVYLRIQHDPLGVLGTPKTDYCEAWDINAHKFSNSTSTYTSAGTNSAGLTAGGGGNDGAIAFLRVCNGVSPIGSQMPTTAGGCSGNRSTAVEWKFDGTLTDSSGNGKTATISSGTPVYVPTPNQNVIAILSTANPPPWANTVSLRAGQPGRLDCRSSFSQSDTGSNVACFWQVLSGPSVPAWDSHASTTPKLTGLVFGDYNTQLTVTDPSGLQSVASAHIGAVATDSNGVVVQADPNAEIIFGPMIAYGQNPWGYEDYWHNLGSQLRTYGSPASYWSWLTTGQGTVSYRLGGNGCGLGSGAGTTLTTAITESSMSIVVNDASKLDLSELPTRILLCNGAVSKVEEVRISATTGMSGPQTLTVAYDGRASSCCSNNAGNVYGQTTPQSYNAGAVVGQQKIKGAGTLFVSDANRPICPAGAPGPSGPVDYSTGTVTMTAGTANIVGVGTAWAISMAQRSDHIRVQATHASGQAFIFVANILTFTDPTHMILSRPYPADADSGTFPYSLIQPTTLLSTEYQRVDGSTGRFMWHTDGCESELATYGMLSVDMGVQNGTAQSGQKYSYKSGLGVQSAFGPNFYGEGLSHRSLYLRSGLASALTNANTMDEYWVGDPEVDGGWHGGIPLLQGGAVIGVMADLILNKSTALTWPQVRSFATSGVANSAVGCNDLDTRDSGYYYSWITLAYMFDPDSSLHTTWKNGVTNIYNRDTTKLDPITGQTGCKHDDNSWANGFIFNTAGPRVNVVNGGTTVTAVLGDTFDPVTACYDRAHGSATVINNSTAITGAGFVSVGGGVTPQIVITGTKNSAPFVQWFQFQFINSTTGNISAPWTGDSGNVTYIIRGTVAGAGPDFAALAASNNDPLLQFNWACTYVDPTHVAINRPWNHASDSTNNLHWFSAYGNASVSLAGYGQQPYMLGIRLRWMDWLKKSADFSSQYTTLASNAATWMHDTAFETDTLAFSYGRIYQACEPTVHLGSIGAGYRIGGTCQNGDETSYVIPNARELNAEGSSAIKVYYETNPNAANKLWGDQAYGAVYGYCPWTIGVYCDALYSGPTTNLTASYIGTFKYFGFFFGMGMSHQWPAVRLGGVQPAQNRDLVVGFNLAGILNATKVSVTATAPSGALTTTTCTSSPCTITGDARQGAYLITLTYKNAGNGVLAVGDPLIVAVQ